MSVIEIPSRRDFLRTTAVAMLDDLSVRTRIRSGDEVGALAEALDRIVAVSRRIGHSNPTVTLTVYAHLFGDTDERAVSAVEDALAGALVP